MRMPLKNIHEKRASYCLALARLLESQGYIKSKDMPTLEDYMGLTVSELAVEYKCDKEFVAALPFREQLAFERFLMQ
jgi:hypothetical protein